jgi:hypothetical protein
VATLDGPTKSARIGTMQGPKRNVERVFDPSRKDAHWGKQIEGGSATNFKPKSDAPLDQRVSEVYRTKEQPSEDSDLSR